MYNGYYLHLHLVRWFLCDQSCNIQLGDMRGLRNVSGLNVSGLRDVHPPKISSVAACEAFQTPSSIYTSRANSARKVETSRSSHHNLSAHIISHCVFWIKIQSWFENRFCLPVPTLPAVLIRRSCDQPDKPPDLPKLAAPSE